MEEKMAAAYILETLSPQVMGYIHHNLKIGNLWEKGEKKRLYIEPKDFISNLEVEYYGTGNVSSVKIDGESVSNTYYRKYINDPFAKSFIDLHTGDLYLQNVSDDLEDYIKDAIQEIKGKAQELPFDPYSQVFTPIDQERPVLPQTGVPLPTGKEKPGEYIKRTEEEKKQIARDIRAYIEKELSSIPSATIKLKSQREDMMFPPIELRSKSALRTIGKASGLGVFVVEHIVTHGDNKQFISHILPLFESWQGKDGKKHRGWSERYTISPIKGTFGFEGDETEYYFQTPTDQKMLFSNVRELLHLPQDEENQEQEEEIVPALNKTETEIFEELKRLSKSKRQSGRSLTIEHTHGHGSRKMNAALSLIKKGLAREIHRDNYSSSSGGGWSHQGTILTIELANIPKTLTKIEEEEISPKESAIVAVLPKRFEQLSMVFSLKKSNSVESK